MPPVAYCPQHPDGGVHCWHQPIKQINRIQQDNSPLWICCFCGTVIAEVLGVGPSHGSHVMPMKKNEFTRSWKGESMMPDLTFVCPRCGGSNFGSRCPEDPKAPMQRYCHGIVGQKSCGFDWLEHDDWMYFLVDGKRVTETQYAATMEKIRSTPAFGLGMPEAPKS